MSPAPRQTHPADTALALFASADLRAWDRWLVSRHLRQCARCRGEVAAFRESAAALASEAAAADNALPPNLHWNKLAAEMKANIHLGLEIGQIAGRPEPASIWAPWRSAAAMASVAILVAGGFWLNQPQPRHRAEPERGVIVRATDSGIELDENGGSLALMPADARAPAITVGTEGSINVRYLDEDTGEVTIHHVFSQ